MTAPKAKPVQLRIPDGTAEDILNWAKDDPIRAFMALNAETGKEQPRVTLVTALEVLAYDPDGLYVYTGPQELYYPGYGFQGEEGEVVPAHASPGMDPVMFVPAGGQDLPIPPRDGNWAPGSGKMGDKKDSPDTGQDG
jgi:hypothetical protein